MSDQQLPAGVEILEVVSPEMAEILTPEALSFVAGLQREFSARRAELLAARAVRQEAFEAGERPDFLPETKHIREDDSWKIAPIPADLQDRRVERVTVKIVKLAISENGEEIGMTLTRQRRD